MNTNKYLALKVKAGINLFVFACLAIYMICFTLGGGLTDDVIAPDWEQKDTSSVVDRLVEDCVTPAEGEVPSHVVAILDGEDTAQVYGPKVTGQALNHALNAAGDTGRVDAVYAFCV